MEINIWNSILPSSRVSIQKVEFFRMLNEEFSPGYFMPSLHSSGVLFLQTGKSWCTTSVCISSEFHQLASSSTIFIMVGTQNHHIWKMELVSSERGLGCTLLQWTQLHCSVTATKIHCLKPQTCRFLHVHKDCMTKMPNLQMYQSW